MFRKQLVYDVLYERLRSTISDSQHGFAKCSITVTNLACNLKVISESNDNKNQIDDIFVDAINGLQWNVLFSMPHC